MRKYLVRACVTEYDVQEILAKDEDEAVKIFIERMDYKFDSDVECDDFTWKDLGSGDVYINADPYADNIRSDYVPDGLDTMTVGELIEALSKFDKDAKVYLKNEKEIWNVFRGLAEYDIEESEILN